MRLCLKQSSPFAAVAALTPAILFAVASAANASSAPSFIKPLPVVRATTQIQNQGAPTLDLLDLERFFDQEPTEERIGNRVPFATALSIWRSLTRQQIADIILFTVLAVLSIIWLLSGCPLPEIGAGPRVDSRVGQTRRKRRTARPDYDKRIIAALAQASETDNFSDGWCQASAEASCDELLTNARKIEEDEVERRLNAKDREKEYKRIAAYATGRYGQAATGIKDALRRSEELPHRLLHEAKKHREGRSQ